MEKYAVVIDESKTLEKKGSQDERCPDCGTVLKNDPEKNVPYCPYCGTRPFEQR